MTRWFRLYDEMLDDPKVQMLSPELFKTWVNLLALASRNDGKLPAIDAVAFALRVSATDMRSRLDDLILAGLIDIADDKTLVPHNWHKRQWKSDDSKERVRRHREKRFSSEPKAGNGNGHVTVTVTTPETDSESETESGVCERAGEPEREVEAKAETVTHTATEIRHRAFVISLPAIELAVLASGLPKPEIKRRCLANALQWAAEIDAGKLPRDVLPQKIANFLRASIMGEVNRDVRPIHRANARPVSPRADATRRAGDVLARMMAEAQAEAVQ